MTDEELAGIRQRNGDRRGTHPRVLCDHCGEDGDTILSDIDTLLAEVERLRKERDEAELEAAADGERYEWEQNQGEK